MQKQNTQQRTQWKGIFMGICILAVIGYLASVILTEEESAPASSVSVISSETRNSTSTSAILTKEESTLASSGTETKLPPCNLVNPFSGATDCKKEEKAKFVKPNTEWKMRTLNINGRWLTYEFGKGNPASVDLKESELKGCSFQEAGAPYCTDNGDGYVDATLEKALIDLFNLPNWNQIITNCQQQFLDTDNRKPPFRADTQDEINFSVLQNLSSYISMEDIIVVNPETGRKNISRAGYQKLMNIFWYVGSATWYSHNAETIEPNYSKCVDTYGAPIINSLINIRSMPWV